MQQRRQVLLPARSHGAPVVASEEAASVKDSAEKVKEALQEARKAQTAASSAIQQASADIQSTNSLLSSVSTQAPPEPRRQNTPVTAPPRAAFRWSRKRQTRS